MRSRNSSGVSFLGLGGLDFAPDLLAFFAATFFVRDEAAFFERDEAVADCFLRVEV